ncbi:hypothetical protein MKZ38_002608 [Zalerion maritima]|uniref:Uncharacterized protein n=1 Tax=Zalerion maritima TaxID=339359 RepID=A0AAD5RPI7_9PEZI|nr:hypothetical protein MKZ38_002608 [Zalerion maritima]
MLRKPNLREESGQVGVGITGDVGKDVEVGYNRYVWLTDIVKSIGIETSFDVVLEGLELTMVPYYLTLLAFVPQFVYAACHELEQPCHGPGVAAGPICREYDEAVSQREDVFPITSSSTLTRSGS